MVLNCRLRKFKKILRRIFRLFVVINLIDFVYIGLYNFSKLTDHYVNQIIINITTCDST